MRIDKVVTKTITETREGYITTETTTFFSDTPIIINKEKIICPIKPVQPLRVTKSIKPIQKPQVNIEDEYILHENLIDNIKIIVKEYDDYITLHYECENIINNNNFLYYINI